MTTLIKNYKIFNTNCYIYNTTEKFNLILTDPPYNINYNYNSYKDNLEWSDYYNQQINYLLQLYNSLLDSGNLLYLNYPETNSIIWTHLIKKYNPIKQIFWVYHSHSPSGKAPLRRGIRSWLWLSKTSNYYCDILYLKGEYRNPTDRRVKKLIEQGRKPIDYDWWNMEQVKNVSKEKTAHPCQLPLSMIERLVCTCCPKDGLVFDPYMGSGTTGEAALKNNRQFIGIEQDKDYFEICKKRLSLYEN